MSHEEILQVIRERVTAATAQRQCEADYAAGNLKDTIKLKTQDGKDKIVKYTKEQVIARCIEKKTPPTGKAPFAVKPQENRTIKKSDLEQIIKEEIANVIEGEGYGEASSEKTDELVAAKEQELEDVTAAIMRLASGRKASFMNPFGGLSGSQKDALRRRRKQREKILADIEDLKATRYARSLQ